MAYLLTFLEGIVTFASPCLLPMLPLYLAYFAGDTASGAASQQRNMRKTLIGVLGFTLGFTLVFCTLGAFAGTLGSLLVRYDTVLNIVCGAIVVLFGLGYLGVLRLPMLHRSSNSTVKPHGFLRSLAFGIVFSISWTPCVGTFLAAALSLAANSASTVHGVALLLCFSLGLGLPFAISALLIDQLSGAFAWIKQHFAIIERVSGVALIVMGVLMATGLLGAWMQPLSIS